MRLPSRAEIDPETAIGFRVDLEPRGKGRPRAVRKKNGKLGAITDDKTRSWKEAFQLLATGAARASAEQIARINLRKGAPLRVELELYFKKPKRAEWFCTSPVDNDNAEKNVWDALQGVFFRNDNRIVCNETMKDWSEGEPYMRVRIVALKEKR